MNLSKRWTLATALGFCGAFVSFPLGERLSRSFAPASIADIQFGDLPEHLRPDALPPGMDLSTYETLYDFGLLMHVPALLVFGIIVGAAQYLVLRRLLPRAWLWVVGTAVGFALILVLESVERHIVIGPTTGPVEPILIVFGGGALAGVLQWLYLRRHVSTDWRYLVFWIVGLVAGVAVAVPAMIGIGMAFGDAIGRLAAAAPTVVWGIEIGLFGLIFGSMAGWVSGRGLREIFSHGQEGARAQAA